ncbi:MAG: hypothetical protein K6T73_01170 [Candidatus Bathyarchaeota archaeon]|nr:hypothetical protein [Candidatus Bathyarchaeota archaeon]
MQGNLAKEGLGELVWPFAVEQSMGERFTAIPFDFSLAANGSDTKTYRLSTGFDFILAVINSYSTGAFKLQITDDYTTEDLFISQVRGSLVSGDGKYPFIMPKTHKFLAGRSITVTAVDISGASNTIEVVLIGHKSSVVGMVVQVPGVPGASKTTKYELAEKALQKYVIDRLFLVPFNFTLDGTANKVYADKYPLSKGFDFMWEVLNSNIPDVNITLQIKDEFVTEDFFSSPVRASLITGDGKQPFILPRPYIFQGGTNISLTITDTPGTNATIQTVFIGYKVTRVA